MDFNAGLAYLAMMTMFFVTYILHRSNADKDRTIEHLIEQLRLLAAQHLDSYSARLQSKQSNNDQFREIFERVSRRKAAIQAREQKQRKTPFGKRFSGIEEVASRVREDNGGDSGTPQEGQEG